MFGTVTLRASAGLTDRYLPAGWSVPGKTVSEVNLLNCTWRISARDEISLWLHDMLHGEFQLSYKLKTLCGRLQWGSVQPGLKFAMLPAPNTDKHLKYIHWDFVKGDRDRLIEVTFFSQSFGTNRLQVWLQVHILTFLFRPLDNASNDQGVRFICGPAVSLKVELPSKVPEGLQLIGATLQSGTHYAVLCCQSFIAKGTRFGPYEGTAVKPSEVGNREDTAFMWEVKYFWTMSTSQIASKIFCTEIRRQ